MDNINYFFPSLFLSFLLNSFSPSFNSQILKYRMGEVLQSIFSNKIDELDN